MDKWEENITGKEEPVQRPRWEHECTACLTNRKRGWSGPGEGKQGTKTKR